MGPASNLGIFKTIKVVEVKAETTTPGEVLTTTDANGARVNAMRTRRTLPKLEFVVNECGAIVRGPQRNYELSKSQYSMQLPVPSVSEDYAEANDGMEFPDTVVPFSLMDRKSIFEGARLPSSEMEKSEALCVDKRHGISDIEANLTRECVLNDSRASAVGVCYDQAQEKFVCGSSVERFSGHTGVCRVLGSKKYTPVQHRLELGDLIRIGSVGLVVMEINRTEKEENAKILGANELEVLKNRFLSVPLQQSFNTGLSVEEAAQKSDLDQAVLSEEERMEDEYVTELVGSAGEDEEQELKTHDGSRESSDEDEIANTETKEGKMCSSDSAHVSSSRPICRLRKDVVSAKMDTHGKSKRSCYICYDDDVNTIDNPLVAPCACRGDTKYLHLKCLKRWNHNLDDEGKDPNPQRRLCVVTNLDGLYVCTICKMPYAINTRLEDGRVISLLPDRLKPPYVTFAVVTPHDIRNRANALTNTRFQLSFAGLPSSQKELTIGRSTSNHMMVRYRTVSQLHAKVKFKQGEFYLMDASSSNGTLLFLSEPMKLEWNEPTHVKIGRTILTLNAKKKLKWVGASLPTCMNTALASKISRNDGRGGITSQNCKKAESEGGDEASPCPVAMIVPAEERLPNSEVLDGVAHGRHAEPTELPLRRSDGSLNDDGFVDAADVTAARHHHDEITETCIGDGDIDFDHARALNAQSDPFYPHGEVETSTNDVPRHFIESDEGFSECEHLITDYTDLVSGSRLVQELSRLSMDADTQLQSESHQDNASWEYTTSLMVPPPPPANLSFTFDHRPLQSRRSTFH